MNEAAATDLGSHAEVVESPMETLDAFSFGIRQPSMEEIQSRPVVVLTTSIVGLLLLWLLSRFKVGRSRSNHTVRCCCAKLVSNRKPTASNLSSEASSASVDPAAVQAIRHQIYMIHAEVVKLKSEREAVDNELIETSTQILQSLGDQIHRVGSPGTDAPLSSSQVLRDLTYDDLQHTQRVLPVVVEQEMHVPQTVRVQSVDPPIGPSKPVHAAPVEPSVHVPIPSSVSKSIPPSTGSGMETNPAGAVPKMSAIAAARMKRETETPTAKAGGPGPASNPFGQPAKAPFGR